MTKICINVDITYRSDKGTWKVHTLIRLLGLNLILQHQILKKINLLPYRHKVHSTLKLKINEVFTNIKKQTES